MALKFPEAFYDRKVKEALAESPIIRGFATSDEPAVDAEHDQESTRRIDLS